MTAAPIGRRLLARTALASGLAAPALAAQAGSRTLRMVPHSDLVWIDPTFWPYLVTRNHALMVYDTLYGVDAKGAVQPQMAEGHSVENDGRLWRIRLREGLTFHDGTPVLARDCTASILRWGTHTVLGQSLMSVTQEICAPDDRTIQFRLTSRFPLLADALASPTMQVCAMMPARIADNSDFRAITEVVGSGPFRYLAAERAPGSRAAYARHQAYVPRASGTPSFLAGPKVAHFDRVEWLPMPDEEARAALRDGRVDWWEAPPAAANPTLATDPRIALKVHDHAGFIGTLRVNHLTHPFKLPATRRALLRGIDQAGFMAATGTLPGNQRAGIGYFCPCSSMASTAGMAAIAPPPDITAAREALRAAGSLGARIVVTGAGDLAPARGMAEFGAGMLRRIGFDVALDLVPLRDLVPRLLRPQPSGAGGWNVVFGYWSGFDMWDPGVNRYLRGDGPAGEVGWPTSEHLEALRRAWLMAPDEATRRSIAADMQVQAFVDVPYLPLGQWTRPTAYDRGLTGMLDGFPLFWNLRRDG
jgi:peptide/nickel transport system substrate-binding protein